MSARRRALVTGAAGFLGSRIATTLAADGYDVVGIDRVAAGDGAFRATVMSLPDDGLADLIATEQPTLVVHTAGPASVAASLASPLSDFHGSVGVTAGVLDAVRSSAPEARVVLLSSAAVYGDPEALPVLESAPLQPLSPYGFHKVICETLAREYHEVYGLRTGVVRIFSAYGAGLARQLLWDVCEKARTQDVVRLFGTGDETRDFVHADDVARAIRVIAESAPLAGDTYNLASGEESTVREIAEALTAIVAPGRTVEFSGETRPGDPLRWRADISALRALGFTPGRTLADGLAEYAGWYLERHEGAR